MSDFSSKCREYLTDTGETVYQLASSSGLDRTSLQRMLTGKRLPSIDFIHQFCDSIRINPSQRLELMELYKIEKIGKEVYYNRKYIQELLRVISSQQTISPSGFQRLPSLPFYRGDFSFDVEKKVFSLFEDILDSGSDEEICTNIPASCDPDSSASSESHRFTGLQYEPGNLSLHHPPNPVRFSQLSAVLLLYTGRKRCFQLHIISVFLYNKKEAPASLL